MMKRFVSAFFLLACICVANSAKAQDQLDQDSRDKYYAAMREAKHEFIARELALTQEQQDAFFPLYDQMEDEVKRISDETRDLAQKVANNEEATDTEVESAARTLFEQKSREGQVEVQYFEQFKSTLNPKQLIRLKNAERKFTQQLVKHRGARNGAKGGKK